jgi:hypothetical protein
MSRQDRVDDQKRAFQLMLATLGDKAIDTCLFSSDVPPFDKVLRTTWEGLERAEYVDSIPSQGYRLTAKGWLASLELSGVSSDPRYRERIGRVLAVMKRHVKGRKDSSVLSLSQLVTESGEPEGFIFNIVDSRSSSTGNSRQGADWFKGERGRMVEIPVDFNLEPVDVAAALTNAHLERIELLGEQLRAAEEDRGQFHCPYCDAPLAGIAHQDYPEYHCIVTYESFECGFMTGDGNEEHPCPYGPNWPKIEEFEFESKPNGRLWVCYPTAKTKRARKVSVRGILGRTKEEAEEFAKNAVAPIEKGSRRAKTDWLNH